MASVPGRDDLQKELKTKRICRFCLSQQVDKLGNIYSRDARIKSAVPLPLQAMACVSIEVLSNDGMPSTVCYDCRLWFEYSYNFKQMCKRAETALREYPLTGQWPEPLERPKIPQEMIMERPFKGSRKESITDHFPLVNSRQAKLPTPDDRRLIVQKASQCKQPPKRLLNANPARTPEPPVPKVHGAKKLLNANPAKSPEPPVPVRFKKEKYDEETTNFLNKVENDEELSMDDVQRLIAAVDPEEEEAVAEDEEFLASDGASSKGKPKLLNKASMRILNKEADVELEPRLSQPKLKEDDFGNVEIVTEILDPNEPYESEPDPTKNAEPVETNVYPCPHCERSFPLRQLRDIHMVNHNRERCYHCGGCDKSFFTKYDLQKHSLIHTGDRPYKCTVCDKDFTRATLLYRHEKTHTDIPKFICVYCEKPFISKDEMEKHTERHKKNRPFQCKLCGKSFAFKQGLERHEVVHSREQPYPCQYCDQSFSTPSKLARHLTAHAGKRPYPCKFCSKSYLLSHHLTRHLRSHKQGLVIFSCTHCEKQFGTRDDLIYHSAVHATQTLECPLCKEGFESVETVTEHIKQHAQGEAFACEFCDLIFMGAERLGQHTDQEHADDMAAYHADDKAQAEKARAKQRSEEGIESVEDLPPSDDFFMDEDALAAADDDVLEESLATDGLVKQEFNNAVASKDAEGEPAVVQPPSAKIRKIFSGATVSKKPQAASSVAPQPRRKIPEASPKPKVATPQRRKPDIKIKDIQITNPGGLNASGQQQQQQQQKPSAISSMLKSLPKSVSVRRSTPVPQPQPQKADKSSAVSPRAAARRSNEAPAGKPSPKPASVAKRSPAGKGAAVAAATTATPSSSGANESPQKGVVKMMLGDKKVRMQKITVSKAEAAAMAKEGRIRIQDGKIIAVAPNAPKAAGK